MATVAIPSFDPRAERGPVYRALSALLLTRFGRWFAIDVAAPIDPWLLRLTRGRLGLGLALPSAALTTVGARSGASRTTAILYYTEGDDVILIASNFGRERHPAWYHNLTARPEALLQRGGVRARYLAREETDPAEQARLFDLAISVAPVYANYRERTDAIGRRIPILRLTPAD
jgi:deazaflavin-dependent oxidoreductase (nitroreductase family)